MDTTLHSILSQETSLMSLKTNNFPPLILLSIWMAVLVEVGLRSRAKDYPCNNKNHLFLIFMTNSIDFKRYEKFVDAVTSDESTDFLALSDRLVELDRKGANIERLLTAGVGINAEGGEFLEIVKKMIFQGKPFDAHNKEHMIIELGDLMWYVAQACMALEIDFEDVIARNVQKLEKRYPGGKFDIYYSENRAEDDL